MQPHSNKANKKILLMAIALIAILAVAGLIWLIVAKSNTHDSGDDSDTSQTASNTFDGTMFDAVDKTKGTPSECNWTLDYDGEALVSKGKIYTDGKGVARSKADFESNGETHESNLVIAKDKIFGWYDNDPKSTTTSPRSEIEGVSPNENAFAQSKQVDPNASFNFACQDWEPKEGDDTFNIPLPLSSLPGRG